MKTDVLVKALRDLHWMARRYADMRSSYAPSMFNEHTRKLLAEGVELNGPHFARDGGGRRFDGLTQAEVDAAADDMPRGFVQDGDERLGAALDALEEIANLPEQGGCGDGVDAVDLWMLMQKRARKAIEVLQGMDLQKVSGT